MDPQVPSGMLAARGDDHGATEAPLLAEARLDAAWGTSPGGLAFPRTAGPALDLPLRDPRRFILRTPWHEFSGDLSQGLLIQGQIGPDGAGVAPICHSGNIFAYRSRGRPVSIDVEAGIASWGLERLAGQVVLFHETVLEGPCGLFGRRMRLGRLRYEYRVPADSPVLHLTVRLALEGGIALQGVRLSTALDAMSPEAGSHAIRRVTVQRLDGPEAGVAMDGADPVTLQVGPAQSLLFEDDSPTAALATRLQLSDGHRLASAQARRRADGALHWTVLRYAIGSVAPGGVVVLREERLRLPRAFAADMAAASASAHPADPALPPGAGAPRRTVGGGQAALHLVDLALGNIKAIGSELARLNYAAGRAGPAAVLPVAPRRAGLGSRICTQHDLEQEWLHYWCRRLRMAPLYHRKVWEDCFVLQVLWESGMIGPGMRGLGFAVGQEPLPALMAAEGVHVLASDLGGDDARAAAWRNTSQHASEAEALFRPDLVDRTSFDRLVRFRPVDMAVLPADLLRGEFDFLWSVCSLEHLGSLEAGARFVRDAMRALRPGGIAVHTTEYNLDPSGETLASGSTVLYQRRHLDRLAADLAADGHSMLPLQGSAEAPGFFDRLVDLPPYPHEGGAADAPHLRLALAGHTVTSAGLVIRAGPGRPAPGG